MTRCNRKIEVPRTRAFRIERLEPRQMLSFGGLGFDCTHGDLEPGISESDGSALHAGSSRSNRHSDRGPLNSLDSSHGQSVSSNGDSRSAAISFERHQRRPVHGGREAARDDSLGSPLRTNSFAEGELVFDSSANPRGHSRDPDEFAIRETPIVDSMTIVVIAVPSVSIRLVPVSVNNPSRPETPQTDLSSPPSSIRSSPPASASIRRADEDSPADTATLVQGNPTDAVQLVSIPARDVDSIHRSTQDASTVVNVETPNFPRGSSFAIDSLRLHPTPRDQWLKHNETIELELAELEELLDTIAAERESRDVSESIADTTPFPNSQVDTSAATTPSTDTILLLPGMSVANCSAQMKTQVFGEIDDTAIAQWTVGIGIYDALEVAGSGPFSEATITHQIALQWLGIEAPKTVTDRDGVLVWRPESTSPSSRAAGVVFCCLGAQFLRHRRKHASAASPDGSNRQQR